ncbi:uncharacterized protein LOC119674445 [Teleopsis dalmanni]|uniref:uncharacterized protein LOC119664632 n=1 Tax=Teleopsis dalmanni TaxID=139649 RepID=UPI0018CDF629|nr:uncharacterized protein LOC119664632 [Teleopsis dalmanni]XP_037941515.1 uncharacterized protein LOC119674445 [Teleopsis dalmanni]
MPTTNPFLKFLQKFRAENRHLSSVEIAKRGGAKWRKMSAKEKLKYAPSGSGRLSRIARQSRVNRSNTLRIKKHLTSRISAKKKPRKQRRVQSKVKIHPLHLKHSSKRSTTWLGAMWDQLMRIFSWNEENTEET